MKPLTPLDTGFLLLERRNQPMHVGGLTLLESPEGDEDFVSRTLKEMMAYNQPTEPFNKRLRKRAGVWFWEEDKDFDIEAHVIHLSLPKPGRIRELLALVSKLHGTLLDRTRPMWEMYVIEGVEGGRVAVYSRIHHALVDGVAAVRILQKSTTDTPDEQVEPFWALPKAKRPPRESSAKSNPMTALLNSASNLKASVRTTGTIAREVMRSIRARKEDPDYVSVFQAPETILNQRISGSRRFAAQSYSLERIKKAGKRHDATINDVILAMCSSALRQYLIDFGQLPNEPLVSMVPVSMRTDDSSSGNQIAMVLANLATHVANPVDRLHMIHRSIQNSKDRFARLSQTEIMGYLGTVMAIHGVNMALGIKPTWQAFNIVISNVPGPNSVRYFQGAKITGQYPVSIVLDGAALNITLNSYADNMEIGLIACRRTLPSMQRLLQYLDDGLAELENEEPRTEA